MTNQYSTFSIELKKLTKLSIESKESFVEGNLGVIQEVTVHDDVLLKITGSNGVLRVDLPTSLIRNALGGGNL
jgi:hypothetical protein